MDARAKSGLLWGVVGLLSFLVLIQAFELVTGDPVDWGIKAVVAVVVGIAAAVTTSRPQGRLVDDDSQRSTDKPENESP